MKSIVKTFSFKLDYFNMLANSETKQDGGQSFGN